MPPAVRYARVAGGHRQRIVRAVAGTPEEADGRMRRQKDEDRRCGDHVGRTYYQDGAGQQSRQQELRRVFRPVEKKREDDVDDGAGRSRGPRDHELFDDDAVENGAEANTADAARGAPKWRDILMKQSAVMSRQIALGEKERMGRHRFVEEAARGYPGKYQCSAGIRSIRESAPGGFYILALVPHFPPAGYRVMGQAGMS